jgi:hypothetical protein
MSESTVLFIHGHIYLSSPVQPEPPPIFAPIRKVQLLLFYRMGLLQKKLPKITKRKSHMKEK